MKRKKTNPKISSAFLLSRWMIIKQKIEKEEKMEFEILHRFAVKVRKEDTEYLIKCNLMDGEFYVFEGDKILNITTSLKELDEWIFDHIQQVSFPDIESI